MSEPKTMVLNYELFNGRSFWHSDCTNHFGGVVVSVRDEADRSLMKCLHCKQHGWYQRGWIGKRTVPVEPTPGVAGTPAAAEPCRYADQCSEEGWCANGCEQRAPKTWQHDETGRITESFASPGPRWAEVPRGVAAPAPDAWLREDGMKAMPDDEKAAWIKAGRPEICEDYSIPLYRAAGVTGTQPAEPPWWAGSLNRRATVEQWMFDAARGKRPMPTADELRAWAIKLGTPDAGEPHAPTSERERFERWCDEQYGSNAYLHKSGTCGEWDAWHQAWITGRNALVNELADAAGVPPREGGGNV